MTFDFEAAMSDDQRNEFQSWQQDNFIAKLIEIKNLVEEAKGTYKNGIDSHSWDVASWVYANQLLAGIREACKALDVEMDNARQLSRLGSQFQNRCVSAN